MEPGAEGSPITLAERCTLSFANRKIILGSTPTLEATSNVLRSYALSDQRVYEVPCPECGHFHEIAWADMDVQRDRLELVFVGHGRDETFILGQSVIWGDPHGEDVWSELDEALRTIWPHPNGGFCRVDAAAIDAGDGEMMDRVVAFCRPRLGRRIVAIKGVTGNRPAIKASDSKGSKLFIVGVDGLKGQLTSRLTRGRSVRFSDALEARFYEELTSERLMVRYVRGAPVRLWERIPGRRAESLDAVVYALAVRGLVTANLDRREEEVASPTVKARRPTVIRSAWMEGR